MFFLSGCLPIHCYCSYTLPDASGDWVSSRWQADIFSNRRRSFVAPLRGWAPCEKPTYYSPVFVAPQYLVFSPFCRLADGLIGSQNPSVRHLSGSPRDKGLLLTSVPVAAGIAVRRPCRGYTPRVAERVDLNHRQALRVPLYHLSYVPHIIDNRVSRFAVFAASYAVPSAPVQPPKRYSLLETERGGYPSSIGHHSPGCRKLSIWVLAVV